MSTGSPHAAAVTAAPPHPAAAPPPHPPAKPSPLRSILLGAAGLVIVGLALYYGVPMLVTAFNTVSTDDAYVNSHVTAVAARVPGQVAKVLVDDNNRVRKGDVLVRIDSEPYQVQVDLKQAAVDSAKADLEVAIAQVQATVAMARSSRFRLEHSIENVNLQVAQLHATIASLDSDLAIRDRAKKDFERIQELVKKQSVATQEADLALQTYLVAKAKVRQGLENVYQIRAGLGLTTPPVEIEKLTVLPENLGETPKNLDQTFSTVRQSAAEIMSAIAPLGVKSSSFDLEPKQILQEFLDRDPDPKGDPAHKIDRIYADIIKKAPSLVQARAKVALAQRDLDDANLNFRYCTVVAEIDGVVTRRNVNPGNNVQAGQSLMAIRSLTEIWIDANFKETQLADLRIGQPVKIETDIYGSRTEFEGRITGFTMGTGQTLALLPPQNATGNFVKIVQRLPVKIELDKDKYDPDKTPLFVGLSVTPYVYFRKPLVGDDPGKGKALQPSEAMTGVPTAPQAPAGKK
jgi:membrane fusion protein (multidrug efflux system)